MPEISEVKLTAEFVTQTNKNRVIENVSFLKTNKLKLIEETTINDVLLGTDTIVSIESRAAVSLIGKGIAEAVVETEGSVKEQNDNEAEEAK